MEQKIFYSTLPYTHNVPFRFLGRENVCFGRRLKNISRTNTLAYFTAPLVTKKNVL